MSKIWVTNGSTSIAPVINPLNAACHDGYVPTDVYVLDNPEIETVTESVVSAMKTIITAQGGDEPTVTVETIADEMDFRAIVSYIQAAIEDGQQSDSDVAIDVTPGRKFWSIIGFRAGIEYDVDHLYYIHLETGEYFGDCYPVIPRTAVDLVDFTEVL